jgi:transcriptional regulator with XRE-family HTH domain
MIEGERRQFYKALGAKLKEARTSRGFDPRSVAGQLGVTRTNVYNWEAGRSRLPFDIVVALADIYDIPLDSLR